MMSFLTLDTFYLPYTKPRRGVCGLNRTHSTFLGCLREARWCTYHTHTFEFKDCDGDGIADPTCKGPEGKFGVIQSSKGCADSWPGGTCKSSGNVFNFFYLQNHHFVSTALRKTAIVSKVVMMQP